MGHTMTNKQHMIQKDDWQTKARGSHEDEFQIYLACADDGKGGDITRPGQPLKTFEEWMAS